MHVWPPPRLFAHKKWWHRADLVYGVSSLHVDAKFVTSKTQTSCFPTAFFYVDDVPDLWARRVSAIGHDLFLRTITNGVRGIDQTVRRKIMRGNVSSTVSSVLDVKLAALRPPQPSNLGNLSRPLSTFLYFCRQLLFSWYNEKLYIMACYYLLI